MVQWTTCTARLIRSAPFLWPANPYRPLSGRLYFPQWISYVAYFYPNKVVTFYPLSEAWSGVNWADLMAAQGAFGHKNRSQRRHGQPWGSPNSLRSKPRTEHILIWCGGQPLDVWSQPILKRHPRETFLGKCSKYPVKEFEGEGSCQNEKISNSIKCVDICCIYSF